eukprot:5499679-Alexandrium_andersonii.AAC.1
MFIYICGNGIPPDVSFQNKAARAIIACCLAGKFRAPEARRRANRDPQRPPFGPLGGHRREEHLQ